jgi:Zn-dependent protease with chaperone function
VRFRQHQDQARAATQRLLLLFLLTVLLTVLAVNGVLALLWSLQTGNLLAYPRWFFETNSVLCAAFILGGSWIETVQLRRGGAHVAQMVGARELLVPQGAHEQRLRNVVQEMAIASGLKAPRIFVLDRDDGINAFAAGWEQNDSVVAVTRGALVRLNRDELQGVVAHEFSHILHGDARLNMRLIGHVWGLQLLYLLGRDLFDATDAHGRRTAFVLMGLGLMAVGSIGWLAGRLLKAAVSRQREFLADAAAVQFTRQPQGIGGALRKIAGQVANGPAALRSSRAEVISHMLLWSGIFGGAGVLATHPPLQERIRRIFGRPMAPLPSTAQAAEELAVPVNADDGMLAFEGHGAGVGDPADMAAMVPGLVVQRSPGTGVPAGGASGHLAQGEGTADTPTDPVASTTEPGPEHVRHAPWLDDLLAIPWPHDLVPATLAFLVPAPDGPEYRAWCALFARPRSGRPDHVLRQAWALPPPARQGAFERLLTRCSSLPMSERAALRRQAHRIVRADGRLVFTEIWHGLLLEHVLELRHESVLRETHSLSLQDCMPSIACLTDLMAAQALGGLGTTSQRQETWRAEVGAALQLGTLPPAAGPLDWPAIAGAVHRLARLSWMLRPQPMKAWCALALQGSSPAPQPLVDALRTVCILIDTPMPPRLQASYPEHAKCR